MSDYSCIIHHKPFWDILRQAGHLKSCETGPPVYRPYPSSLVRKFNHLQMSLQRKHFLLSYLKTLSVGPPGLEPTPSRTAVRHGPDTQQNTYVILPGQKNGDFSTFSVINSVNCDLLSMCWLQKTCSCFGKSKTKIWRLTDLISPILIFTG